MGGDAALGHVTGQSPSKNWLCFRVPRNSVHTATPHGAESPGNRPRPRTRRPGGVSPDGAREAARLPATREKQRDTCKGVFDAEVGRGLPRRDVFELEPQRGKGAGCAKWGGDAAPGKAHGPEAAPARRVQNRSGRGVRGAWAPCPARPVTAGAAPLPGRAPALPPLCRGPAEGGRRAVSQSARAGAQVRTRTPAPKPARPPAPPRGSPAAPSRAGPE